MSREDSYNPGKCAVREDSFNPPKMGFEDLDDAFTSDEQMFNNSDFRVDGKNVTPFKPATTEVIAEQQSDAKIEAQVQMQKDILEKQMQDMVQK